MSIILEACVNSALSAIEAQRGGANRVELCENLHDGGTTPSAGTIKFARNNIHIGLYVMIRPRGGDFLYSSGEYEIMKHDIGVAKDLGADGVVFGILRADGSIDSIRMKTLIGLARPMGVTCHRAFDMTKDPFTALEDLIRLGVDRILTSGQKPSAPEGSGLIRDLIRKAEGQIIIMPGSGVKEHNIIELARTTGATEFHIHLDTTQTSTMSFQQADVYMGKPDQSEFGHIITDWQRIEKVRHDINIFEREST